MLNLFLSFFKIGLFTIGGGHAMIPMIKQYALNHNWATLTQIVDFIAISESTPGPFAINIATFIGFKQAGLLGAFLCTLGVVLPSFIIILIIAKYFFAFKDTLAVKKIFSTLRPGIVGLIVSSLVFIAKDAFIVDDSFSLSTFFIFLITFLVYYKYKKIHPIYLVLLSGFLGILFYTLIL